MQLSVRGKQLDVGDALRARVDESLSCSLGKYFGDAALMFRNGSHGGFNMIDHRTDGHICCIDLRGNLGQ
jgi:ribosome-associated translation inhibitor RaiA